MVQTLASRIRDARVIKGLTQERIAKALGVSKAAVGQWERGTTAPTFKNLQALEALLSQEISFGLGPINDETENIKPLEWRMMTSRLPSSKSSIDLPVRLAVVGKGGRCVYVKGPDNEAIEYIYRPAILKNDQHSYAVAIASTVMSPRFEIDETLYVSTMTPPTDGEYVILSSKNGTPTEGVRLYHLLIEAPDHVMVEQFMPRQVYVVQKSDVLGMDRVVPWGELIEPSPQEAEPSPDKEK